MRMGVVQANVLSLLNTFGGIGKRLLLGSALLRLRKAFPLARLALYAMPRK